MHLEMMFLVVKLSMEPIAPSVDGKNHGGISSKKPNLVDSNQA